MGLKLHSVVVEATALNHCATTTYHFGLAWQQLYSLLLWQSGFEQH